MVSLRCLLTKGELTRVEREEALRANRRPSFSRMKRRLLVESTATNTGWLYLLLTWDELQEREENKIEKIMRIRNIKFLSLSPPPGGEGLGEGVVSIGTLPLVPSPQGRGDL